MLVGGVCDDGFVRARRCCTLVVGVSSIVVSGVMSMNRAVGKEDGRYRILWPLNRSVTLFLPHHTRT
jgi:hypothetical protein